MSFTLIGKHEKDSRNNRDGYVTAMPVSYTHLLQRLCCF